MIKIFLGNIGSGKTVSAVREMLNSPEQMQYYTNIETSKFKRNTLIDKTMIIKEDIIGYKKNNEPITKKVFNSGFWKQAVALHSKKDEGVSIIIDEAHSILNARRSMSKNTECILNFLALVRRIIAYNPKMKGDLLIISQLERRLDIVCREMGGLVKYHIMLYKLSCDECGRRYSENNETPEPRKKCMCGSYNLTKHSHVVYVRDFKNIDDFQKWKYFGNNEDFCCRRYLIRDIENYFPFYNTLQWEFFFD